MIYQEPSEITDGQEIIVVRANRPKRKLEVDIDLSLPRGKRSCVLKHANVAAPEAPEAPVAPSRKRGQRGPGKKVKDIKDTEIIKKTTALNKEVTSDQQYLLI